MVHLVGGCAALVSTCVLGTRHGRFPHVPRWRGEFVWGARRRLARLLRPSLPARLYAPLAKRLSLDVAENKMLQEMRMRDLSQALPLSQWDPAARDAFLEAARELRRRTPVT